MLGDNPVAAVSLRTLRGIAFVPRRRLCLWQTCCAVGYPADRSELHPMAIESRTKSMSK